MRVKLTPGKYVVAVSGGVDSMVLLDVLSRDPSLNLIVAHFDHGIRSDSGLDRQYIIEAVNNKNIPFYFSEGKLGPHPSEALAREKRYEFLKSVMTKSKSLAIVTAHHEDDLLETVFINIIRGTNRRGLSSLKSTETLIRPLLGVSKEQIKEYAQKHAVKWREDSTNHDESYLRNYVRIRLIPRLSVLDRERLLDIIRRARLINEEIDRTIDEMLSSQASNSIRRNWFSLLPHDIAKNVMTAWLMDNAVKDLDSRTLDRLSIEAKTKAPGKTLDIKSGYSLKIDNESLTILSPER